MTKPLQDTTACKRFKFSKHCKTDCWVLEMVGNEDHFYLCREADWREIRDLLCEHHGLPEAPDENAIYVPRSWRTKSGGYCLAGWVDEKYYMESRDE